MSLTLRKIDTVEVRVDIAIPPENPQIKGFLLCDAIVRNKKEMERIMDDLNDGSYKDDGEFLRNAGKFFNEDARKDAGGEEILGLFKNIRGLKDENGVEMDYARAIKEVTEGELSSYLILALTKRYFQQFGEAQGKNSGKSRSRY